MTADEISSQPLSRRARCLALLERALSSVGMGMQVEAWPPPRYNDSDQSVETKRGSGGIDGFDEPRK